MKNPALEALFDARKHLSLVEAALHRAARQDDRRGVFHANQAASMVYDASRHVEEAIQKVTATR